MACTHLDALKRLQSPKLSQSVHREECTQCFDNQDHPLGVDVCLTCFNGGCLSSDRHHARTHVERTGHTFTLNVRRKPKPSSSREDDTPPPAKMTKLAIVAQREEDAYVHVTAVKCWACDPVNGAVLPEESTKGTEQLIRETMSALSSARQSEVQAWEEEITACEHTLYVDQSGAGKVAANGLAHCTSCTLKENLWLCLTCGSLGCGRAQYGAGNLSGNGHGLKHYEDTKHPVSVKLGTISAEGAADIYCYACNDARIDPELGAHLATFGINVAAQQKTEKSMTELQIEQNLKFDFSLTDDRGQALEPVFGPGLTGLQNLGNSCYMASVLQALFALAPFQQAYDPTKVAEVHWKACPEQLPAGCVTCQMLKLADGLGSGRYSHPRPAPPTPAPVSASTHEPLSATAMDIDNATPKTDNNPKATNPLAHDSPVPIFQEGVRPTGFKALVGKGHAEFATMKQQDAEEFFSFLLEALRRDAHRLGQATVTKGQAEAALKATDVFKFGMESRLECSGCRGVRYRTEGADVLSIAVPAREKSKDADEKTIWHEVELEECLQALFGAEELEYRCPKCERDVGARKGTKLASFPAVLALHAKKFQLVNWVPTKLDIPLALPASDILALDAHLGRGLQDGETELPDSDSGAGAAGSSRGAPALPTFNEAAMAQLEGMGFPTIRCQKALLATGNADAEVAMEWLFGHMEDPEIDDPIVLPSTGGASGGASKPEPSAEQIAMLADMGFTSAQARKALQETGGNAERAVEWLFSHPDETGLDDGPATSSGTASAPTADKPAIGGDTTIPARYRLKAFISHKGPSVHSGHYVAHIRVNSSQNVKDSEDADEGWVLFNDEKVVKADRDSVRELRKLAYLYIFERI